MFHVSRSLTCAASATAIGFLAAAAIIPATGPWLSELLRAFQTIKEDETA